MLTRVGPSHHCYYYYYMVTVGRRYEDLYGLSVSVISDDLD